MQKILIVLIFILSSCARQSKVYEIGTVDLDSAKEQNLKIDKKTNTAYGPSSGAKHKNKQHTSTDREPVVGLTLYSTLYNSLSIINLIKQLDSNDINLSMMSANGFGSLLISLYAKEKSISFLEWKLFELRKRLIGLVPFSRNWKKVLKIFLDKEFQEIQLHQMKMLVLIPTILDGELVLQRSGRVADKVYAAIDLSNKSNFIRNPRIYEQKMKEFSADIHLSYYPLSIMPVLVKVEGLNWGLYTKYLGYLVKNTDIIKNESTTKTNIDELQPLSDIQKSFQGANKLLTEKLIDRINQWKQENTASSN
jgi:hypothetical protein